jgi:hypothetical protein
LLFFGEQHIKVAGEVYMKKETAEYLWGYSAESIEFGSLVTNSYRVPFSRTKFGNFAQHLECKNYPPRCRTIVSCGKALLSSIQMTVKVIIFKAVELLTLS